MPSQQPETMTYQDRIALVREGVPVAEAESLRSAWGIPVALFATILGISERKWSRMRSNLSQTGLGAVESDRLLRMHAVLEHALQVFDSAPNAIDWFALPNRALSGAAPMSLMDTDAGVHEVDAVLTRLEFGVLG